MCDTCYRERDYGGYCIPEDFYDDAWCECKYTRISFVPAGTEYYIDRPPKDSPQEVCYQVYVEQNRPESSFDTDIIEDTCHGFSVRVDDIDDIRQLLVIIELTIKLNEGLYPTSGSKLRKSIKFEPTLNARVKKADIYAKEVCDRLKYWLEELKKPATEPEKKENPHMGKRRKKK